MSILKRKKAVEQPKVKEVIENIDEVIQEVEEVQGIRVEEPKPTFKFLYNGIPHKKEFVNGQYVVTKL